MSIKIDNVQVFGFRAALRANRNPVDSWAASDSVFMPSAKVIVAGHTSYLAEEGVSIGPEDLDLLLKLTKNGQSHRKALRFIKIWATLVLPRYVWTEFDTYKVGCDRLSCSTMHKLGTRELVASDFSVDPLPAVMEELNTLGREYRGGGKKNYALVRLMKAHLPESYLQRADVCFNYETAVNMFQQRYNHRLPEWRWTGEKNNESLCNFIHSLPIMDKILTRLGFEGADK